MRRKLVLLTLVCVGALVASTAAASAEASPLRGAFYYPWFPQAWTQEGIYPYTWYTPSLGFYDSGNQTLITKHVKALRYANVDFGIYSWWGPRVSDGSTQKRFPLYLKAARSTPLKWAVYYEEEGYRDPTAAEIAADLNTVAGYAADRAYLKVDGKPVVFVYEGAGDGCATNDRWAQANASVGAYLVQDEVWVDTEPRLYGFAAADAATATAATRVATGDLDGDGRAEVVTAQGAGAPPQVRVWSQGAQTLAFPAYDPSYLGGVNVAAGDLTGDGRAEIVAAPESSSGPTTPIKVYSVSGGAAVQLASFDSGLSSARVAVGDVNGDGKAEIVAAAGPGVAPSVRVFDSSGQLLSQFAAYDVGYTGGVDVAVGNVAGDSRADIVTGTASGADDVR